MLFGGEMEEKKSVKSWVIANVLPCMVTDVTHRKILQKSFNIFPANSIRLVKRIFQSIRPESDNRNDLAQYVRLHLRQQMEKQSDSPEP